MIELASAGSGERAGDGPFALTHLLYRPSDSSPARRAAASRNEQSARLFELVRGDDRGRGRVWLRSGLEFAAPNARPWTCFEAPYEPKRIAWSEALPLHTAASHPDLHRLLPPGRKDAKKVGPATTSPCALRAPAVDSVIPW
jgi:hypothetical protein